MNSFINLPTLILLGIMFVAAGAFVLGAMLWLRRLRASVSAAVSEALARQIEHGKNVEAALITLQKSQKKMEEQVLLLGQAHARARADINTLAQRLEQREVMSDAHNPQGRVIH